MHFTADFLARTAREGGLNVFAAPDQDGHEVTRLRISGGEQLQLIVTVAWNGRREDIVAAKLIEPRWEGGNHVYIPQGFDQVDRYSGAHAYAMLGWVMTEINDMVERKVKEDAAWARHDEIARQARRNMSPRARRQVSRALDSWLASKTA